VLDRAVVEDVEVEIDDGLVVDVGEQRELDAHVIGLRAHARPVGEVAALTVRGVDRRQLRDRGVVTDELDTGVALVPCRHALDVAALHLPCAQLAATPQVVARIAQHLAAVRRADLRGGECEHEE
jgi:hypothetical protein